MAASDLSLEESSDGILWVRLSGSWKIGDALPSSSEVASAVDVSAGLRGVAFDASGVTAWDSGLLTFLRRVLRECAGRELETNREGLPEGVRRLLDLADAVPEQETGTHAEPTGFLERIGTQAIDSLDGFRELLAFVGSCTIAFGRLARGRSRFPFPAFMLVLQDCGPRALGIV
jgi:phospholipid/cholesterol/gamma-HCH transport system permease protein